MHALILQLIKEQITHVVKLTTCYKTACILKPECVESTNGGSLSA